MPTREERLEHGELLVFDSSPFPLPQGEDLSFLLAQSVRGTVRKNISCDPVTEELTGVAARDADRMRDVLGRFSAAVRAWLPTILPRYLDHFEPDRVSYRPEEEATRRLRHNARNDLLHVDAFPRRPARGRRILRVFANVNPTEPRVWVTSDPLHRLLRHHRGPLAQSMAGWSHLFAAGLLDWLRPAEARQEDSDRFMLRLHDYLKSNDEFQQRSPRRLWHFPPGSVWLAMTDGCSYAELRGQHALEHSFFIARERLVCPELAPAQLIAAA